MLEYGNQVPCNTKIFVLQYKNTKTGGTSQQNMIKLTKFLAPPPAFRSVLSFGAFQQLLITLLVHLYPRNRRIVPPPERVTHDVLPHLSSEEKSGLAVSASYEIGTKSASSERHNDDMHVM